MIFLNPAILLGLLAASVPILLHLLNLRRRRQIEFSSLVLLKQLEQSALQKFKIRQWLLLLIRSLIIFFLVASFAKPIIPGYVAGAEFSSHTKTSAVIVLDNSASMGYNDRRNADQWKQAKSAALKVLDNFSEQDEIFLGIGNLPPQPVAIAEAKRQIAQAELSALPFYAESSVLEAINTLSQAKHFNRELYLISDFQPQDFQRRDSTVSYQYGFEFKFYAINVAPKDKKNAALTNVEILTKIFEPAKPVRLEASAKLFGETAPRPSVLSLRFSNKLAAETSLELQPQMPSSAVMMATPTDNGFIAGELSLESDNLESDNRRYFTFYIPEKLRVLIAASDERETQYLRLALESFQNKNFFELVSVSEIALDAQDLSKYDVLMLCGVSMLSASAISRIENFVRQGGGLVVFAHPEKSNLGVLNQLCAAVEAGSVAMLTSVSSAAPLTIEQIEYQHPLFDGIFQSESARRKAATAPTEEPILLFSAVELLRSPKSEVIMSSATGKAFVTTNRHGIGAVTIFASMPKPEQTTLTLQPLFAPLMFRTVLYSSARAKSRNYQFVCGEQSEVSLPVVLTSAENIMVRKPSGKFLFVQAQSRSNDLRLSLEPTLFDEIGIYDVLVRQAYDTTLVMKLAFNLRESESETTSLAPEFILRFASLLSLPEKDFFYAEAAEQVEKVNEVIAGSRYGLGIWKYLVVLAALGLLAESLLARRDVVTATD
jgi:hypothetical protein